ncbi:uncharacterized protein ARMOST_21702 [Armillaria ostoyae]|uniref:Uncharacterized protein n=1 Tax=Armillaria ostoyae TaxID=47428 RepID=A0A284SAT6_ARMOS|nr:uncharacterized protein ARMOST_21702 [Armillaria ostoyae]
MNDLTHLEEELRQIELLFLKVRDRQERLLKDLNGCRSLLAPIRRLLRETLLQIFSILASSDTPNLFDAPWVLGHKILPVAYNNPFSSSPITEATLQRVPYSYLPIDMSSLQRFGLYDPLVVHNVFQYSQHLTEFIITPAGPPRLISINSSAIIYPQVHQPSLRQLSFVLTRENTRQATEIPLTLDYLTLPALQQFQILALQTEQLAAILPGALEPVEYSRIINLFRRSECSWTELTF